MLRRSIALAACLVVAVATLTGSIAPDPAIRVLQMNLCNSGISGCFTNRVIPVAAAAIRDDRPDMVTLNEVCESDVAVLGRTMQEIHSTGSVVWAFRAALDRRTGGATRCLNGQAYGVGLLVKLRGPGYVVTGGEYPDQDLGDPEIRVWLCISGSSDFMACTTHLATNAPVAEAQTRYLLDRTLAAAGPVVIGGDLNLPNPVVPSGVRLTGDGAVQHVIATDGFTIRSSRSFGMAGTTDHPALLVSVAQR